MVVDRRGPEGQSLPKLVRSVDLNSSRRFRLVWKARRIQVGGEGRSGREWDMKLPLEKVNWQSGADEMVCPPGDLDVWRIASGDVCFDDPRWYDCLSGAERERAARFRFEKDCRSYRVSHACKRSILSRYLGLSPARLNFTTGQWGKPALCPQTMPSGVHFNLSHSRGVTLVAVGGRDYVGADVEALQTEERMQPIFDRFASEEERRLWSELAWTDVGRALSGWWVCKEAFIKSVARGLSLPLADFTVDMASDEQWSLTEVPDEFGPAGDYVVRLLDVSPGHMSAVVVKGDLFGIRCYDHGSLRF